MGPMVVMASHDSLVVVAVGDACHIRSIGRRKAMLLLHPSEHLRHGDIGNVWQVPHALPCPELLFAHVVKLLACLELMNYAQNGLNFRLFHSRAWSVCRAN